MQQDIEKSFQTHQHPFHVKFCSASIKEGKLWHLNSKKIEIFVLGFAIIY